jgi:hypothetical protein
MAHCPAGSRPSFLRAPPVKPDDGLGVNVPDPRQDEDKEGWNVVVDDSAARTVRSRNSDDQQSARVSDGAAELVPNERLGFNQEDQPILYSGGLEDALDTLDKGSATVVYTEEKSVLLYDEPNPMQALDDSNGLFVPEPTADGLVVPTTFGVVNVDYWTARQDSFSGRRLPEGWIRVKEDADGHRIFFFSLTTGLATTDLSLVLATAGVVNGDQQENVVPRPPPLAPPREPPPDAASVVPSSRTSSPAGKKTRGVRILGPNEDQSSIPCIDEKHWWYRQVEFEHLPKLPEGWLYVKLNEDDEKVHYYWMATKEIGHLAPWEMGFS